MKSIFLLRHGKAAWGAGHGEDHERPLSRRGEEEAAMMGRYLAEVEQVPDRVISSSALRATETARLASGAGHWSCFVETTRSLYTTTPEKTLDLIRKLDDSDGSVLLVGHEPTWSVMAGQLIGAGSLRMSTAAMIRIDTSADRWSAVGFGTGTLIWMVTPELLGSTG